MAVHENPSFWDVLLSGEDESEYADESMYSEDVESEEDEAQGTEEEK